MAIPSLISYTARASDLGWKADARDHRHKTVEVAGRTFTYHRTSINEDTGDALAWHYRSSDGARLTVFND